ncbi:MAG: hypothetical protein IPP80_12510 [Ignavibacteria bacterium]|nr:hypothetical protein [Ignavibacteria bacterium]
MNRLSQYSICSRSWDQGWSGDDVDTTGWVERVRGLWKGVRSEYCGGLHITVDTVTLVDRQFSWQANTDLDPFVVPTAEYLIEPHNAIIASGRVGDFFAEIGAAVFDPHIAYGAMNVEPPPSPWYERYRVLKIDQGVSVRRIQESIRELGWGSTTIFKKRGWRRPGGTFAVRYHSQSGVSSGSSWS